jgi:hypothetical protein
MDFVYFTKGTEKLEKRVFEINQLYLLIQVVAVYCVRRCEEFFVFDAYKLLLKRVGHGWL